MLPTVHSWASPTVAGREELQLPAPNQAVFPQHVDLALTPTGADHCPLSGVGLGDMDMAGFAVEGGASDPSDAMANPQGVESRESFQDIVRLGGPPAALLLVLQGIACIALFRGRRKWSAVLVALLSLGRSSLCALPQLAVPQKARDSNGAVPTQPIGPAALAPRAPAQSPELVAGSFTQPAILSDAPAVPHDAAWVLALPEETTFLPAATIPFSLLARPPPNLG